MELRFSRPGDGVGMAAIYAPVVISTPISFELEPPLAEEMDQRAAAVAPGHPWLVAEEVGFVAGYAYAAPHSPRAAYRWSVDVSVYVHEQVRRGGVARRLYQALFGLLDEQGYAQAFAGIALPNPASVGFHESVGFAPIGVYRKVGWKLGSWHDVGWWQRPLAGDAHGAEPPPPRAVDQLDPAVIGKVLAAS